MMCQGQCKYQLNRVALESSETALSKQDEEHLNERKNRPVVREFASIAFSPSNLPCTSLHDIVSSKGSKERGNVTKY